MSQNRKSGSDSTNRRSIASEFFKGHHREVVRLSVDSPNSIVALDEIPYVVGALCLIGRVEEAQATFQLHAPALTDLGKIASHFFLGLGFCRQSQYETARNYFGRNLKSSRKCQDGISQFFIHQGIGFYRFFSGRLKSALRASQRSFRHALEVKFLYGKALASDLQGHSLIQTGQISRGLHMLEQAEELANNLGADWLQEAISVSRLTYRARFGLDAASTIENLQAKLKALSREDIYSQSSVLLELAHQLMLRGRLSEATKALGDGCQIIYSSQNRRHEVLLNLRYAYSHYLSGDYALALNLVRNAFKQLDRQVDRLLEIKVRGLEYRLLRCLGLEDPNGNLLRELKTLTRRVGERVGDQILIREGALPSHPSTRGEDALGDLKDRVAQQNRQAIPKILETGYYAFFKEIVDPLSGSAPPQSLHFDLHPDHLIIFDRGTIDVVSEGISRTLRSLVQKLAHGQQTKKMLIESIWKYTYHPLRHDPLIYSAVAKLRKALGERAAWIEVTEHGYRLNPAVQVCFQDVEITAEPTEETASAPLNLEDLVNPLNHRQLQILHFLEKHEFIDAKTCQELFKTSEMTSTRDLNGLVKLHRLQRVGKARATKYMRVGLIEAP